MKKIITASLIFSTLFGVTASAIEFDEKCILDRYVNLITDISGGVISVRNERYGGHTHDYLGEVYFYFDYKGNNIGHFDYSWMGDIGPIYPYEKFDASTEYDIEIDSEEYKFLPKAYTYAKKIDNNEYIVEDKDELYLLTAKGIIGEAFHTDIKLNLNGAIMPCYTVDGYAAIKAEDLGNYGFDVNWSEEDRMLYITRNPEYYDILDKTYPESGRAGTHFSYIYGDDVNVNFNGKRINSYSLDGEMLIIPELSLISDGISFQYSEEDRMLYMHVDGLEQK